MYFMIKDEKLFDKYKTIWEKVSNITIKKINSEFIYNKKYLKAEKKNQNKRKLGVDFFFFFFFLSLKSFEPRLKKCRVPFPEI